MQRQRRIPARVGVVTRSVGLTSILDRGHSIVPGVRRVKAAECSLLRFFTICNLHRVSKTAITPSFLKNNSVKNEPILVIFW